MSNCNPMYCRTPGLPVPYHPQDFTQVHVIQPSHSLMLSSPPALNLSHHQDFSNENGYLHQVTKILELQHQSFHEYSGLISFKKIPSHLKYCYIKYILKTTPFVEEGRKLNLAFTTLITFLMTLVAELEKTVGKAVIR